MLKSHAVSGPLSLSAYPGDGALLIAFNLDAEFVKKNLLAGFAIHCKPPGKPGYFLMNRLSFESDFTSATTPQKRTWTPSDEAPFQKFHWTHFPQEVIPGEYKYTVTVKCFDANGKLADGPSASVSVELWRDENVNTQFGFTRGYISSQAYATKFKNAPIRPAGNSVTFDTKPFAARYSWLGAHAGKLIFNFLKECKDKKLDLDVFAYDLDEPEFVARIAALAGTAKVRMVLDNATLHTKTNAREIASAKILKDAGVALVRGRYSRFAHNKVLIQKIDGEAVRVLTGSANFSVRGLYVQANNVLLFDSPEVAKLYGRAFDVSFENGVTTKAFKGDEISQEWHEMKNTDLDGKPAVAFSPHETATVSLDRVEDALRGANGSVLFAVMEMGGGGDVLKILREIHKDPKVFSYGMTQKSSGDATVFKPSSTRGYLVPFAYLSDKVPAPFVKEFAGGQGQVIHHKFVVVDFNGKAPVVFTGSSNLAEGGEKSNGDNLIEIRDPAVVQAFAVEAIRLVDHYHFRAALKDATKADPLQLQDAKDAKKKPWWKPYYDPGDVRFRQRNSFVAKASGANQ